MEWMTCKYIKTLESQHGVPTNMSLGKWQNQVAKKVFYSTSMSGGRDMEYSQMSCEKVFVSNANLQLMAKRMKVQLY